MRKLFLMIIMLLCISLVFAACGDKDKDDTADSGSIDGGGADSDGTEDDGPTPDNENAGGGGDVEEEKTELKWLDPSFVFFDDYLTWRSDENADSYHIFLDGKDCRVTANEYIELVVSTNKEYLVKIAKEIDGELYFSEEFAWSPTVPSEKIITSMNELQESFYQNGSYQLGSIKYNSIVLDLSSSKESSINFSNTSIKLGTMLDKLTVNCKSGTVLSGFGIVIEERTKPLTIVFKNAELSASRANMISYSGTSQFETTVIVKGTSSFSNSMTGSTGANGSNSSGTNAGSGENGGKGGNIFSVPSLKLFTEKQPTFVTGNGGRGGNGGNGTAWLTHGGHAGSGGAGGDVFSYGSVTVFNAVFRELSASFGRGGYGGVGGSGFTTGKDGADGRDGRLCGSGSINYLSRTDGKIHTVDEDKELGFEASYVSGYLVWCEQPNAVGYEILKDGAFYATTSVNAYYVSNEVELFSGKVTVRPMYSSNQTVGEPSAPVKNYNFGTTLSQASSSLTGGEHFIIGASLLSSVNTLNVGADVKRITIYNDTVRSVAEISLSIVANARSSNLIVDITDVIIKAPTGSAFGAITLNDGNGSPDGTSPMLIINSSGGELYGGTGMAGTNGNDSGNMFAEGVRGGRGENGTNAITAAYCAIMGDSLTATGGNGGRGGDGGDSNSNNGGDGGNGGNGGSGIKCNTVYVVMNEENSPVNLYGASGGAGGGAGEGFGFSAMNSAKPGSNGASAPGLSGNYKKYIGAFVY